ncbi:MAG: dTMP kinase [Ignavibacteria bacterium]|nr:dTMP kinase [Ignavibacteriaceae bacterium]MBN8583514.1 dTMP kinase [Ignavibacteria bacterium]
MFITFEGLDFSGKSTQAKMLHEYLKSKKISSVLLREPGGTTISEKVREIILDREHIEMTPLTEFMLFSASRSQLVSQVIKPHLKKGFVVICDRYYDSSTAYQSYGGKMELKQVLEVNDIATGGLKPDMTILIDIAPKAAFSRANLRGNAKDRMENKNLAYYNKVYKGFKDIANRNKKRFVVIKGSLTISEIHNSIIEKVNKKLKINY